MRGRRKRDDEEEDWRSRYTTLFIWTLMLVFCIYFWKFVINFLIGY